ncbi:hypothetical protein FRX31_006013 [Thalictrum thalictroides]|uniref:Uncharacterized protein n=1 Tax=Thalictrum thalictroides TaxID=46969 RepID=A0A7J6X6A8_THATH|nr:hypothetical protein FRX31_006013 [Thalictrum thalictroides]
MVVTGEDVNCVFLLYISLQHLDVSVQNKQSWVQFNSLVCNSKEKFGNNDLRIGLQKNFLLISSNAAATELVTQYITSRHSALPNREPQVKLERFGGAGTIVIGVFQCNNQNMDSLGGREYLSRMETICKAR